MSKTPIILDTDIGIDIDDSWALAMLLGCEQLDLRLLVTSTGDPVYRGKIAAKFLRLAGRADVPIGIGLESDYEVKPQEKWVEGFELSSYTGKIYEDGIDAMIEAVLSSEQEVVILSIGPLLNIAEALRRAPEISKKARFVGMQGSINYGLGGQPGRIAEYNVVEAISAAQKVFSTDWHMTITPLDTCGIVKLEGERYQKVYNSSRKTAQLLMENYKCWDEFYSKGEYELRSSPLYDTVAVYLTLSRELVNIETIKLIVDDEGYFVENENGREISCALSWRDLEAFKDFLTSTLV